MGKITIKNDNGKEQEFVYESVNYYGEDDDGRTLLKVKGWEVTVGPGKEGVYTIKADQIRGMQ